MTFRLPLTVRCIAEVGEKTKKLWPGVDFGKLNEIYTVQAIVPNGCYYVLRKNHFGDMLGQPGEANHLLNMDRFEPIEWMTEEGIRYDV